MKKESQEVKPRCFFEGSQTNRSAKSKEVSPTLAVAVRSLRPVGPNQPVELSSRQAADGGDWRNSPQVV